MSEPLLPAFRFATEAQWASCLFVGADRRSAAARLVMVAFAPYAPSRRFESVGATAPVVADGALLWCDSNRQLWRLSDCDDKPVGTQAPGGLKSALRIVAGRGTLWAIDARGRVAAFDADTLARLIDLDLGSEATLDIAADGRGGVFVLLGDEAGVRIAHFGSVGQLCDVIALQEVPGAIGLVYLLDAARFVVLAADGSRFYWIDAVSGALVETVLLNTWRGCFDPKVIGSDGCARLFVGGVDGPATGGSGQVLAIDADGDLVGIIPLSGTPTGLTAGSAQVMVTTAAGLATYVPAGAVPLGAAEIEAQLITPALQSSATGGQRWSRIEAAVTLPPGCSLTISVGAAADAATRDRIARLLADASLAPQRRLDAWRTLLAVSRSYTFHGDAGKSSEPGDAPATVAVPLHDITDQYLWAHISVVAAPGSALPQLTGLEVHYPGPALIDQLPAIYRRGEFETGNFLRGFTGVLETTTQNLDARIAELGRNIHPRTAPTEWLDFIAGWMGLPWDEALSAAQKRAIVMSGEALIRGHGTLAGLEQLLCTLMPERPWRFRVTDYTAEYGFVLVGGNGCNGSALPAVLTGLARTSTVLGARAILGTARLPCAEDSDDTARLVGRVTVAVAVDAAERASWQPWLAALIGAMLPAAAQLDLRWLGRGALVGADILADDATMVEEPLAHLGTNAVTGQARLDGRPRGGPGTWLSHDSVLH